MQKRSPGNSSWRNVLALPARASHILQLYDSDDFLSSAVGHFAAEGLKQGEAVLLTGTKEHLAAIERGLRSVDVDVDAARRSGQLACSDVHASIALIAPEGALDSARFEAQACGALERALGHPRFSGVRWWGEVTSTLLQHGARAAGLAAERHADAAAKKYGATIFCPFLCDRFDPRRYDDLLHELCCVHSHVIPAEDYVAHRLAVNRAIAEVVGDIKGPLLQSFASWKSLTCELPSSQALLFWLRDTLPEHFEPVLERARRYPTREQRPEQGSS
jgi:hypothetical protein